MTRLCLAWVAVQEGLGREWASWPESWRIVVGGLPVGGLAWFAFETRIPNMERLPAEILFGFLALYFYAAGYLSGRRTSKTSTGAWAGVIAGLAFGAVVCTRMLMLALTYGVRNTIHEGAMDQVAVGWSGLLFFVLLGAICGSLGAKAAIRARRLGQ
jgi:hypothetical protein